MTFNEEGIKTLFEALAAIDGRFKVVSREMADTAEPDPDAETFLKFEGKRWGRDLELYASFQRLIGPMGIAATLLEEILLPLRSPAPEAFAKGLEIMRDYDVGEDPRAWQEMLDSLGHVDLDDFFYPVDQQKLTDSYYKGKDFK